MLNEQMRCVKLEFGTCGSDPAAEGDCASYDHLPDARLPRSVLLARSWCVLAAGVPSNASAAKSAKRRRSRAGWLYSCSLQRVRRTAPGPGTSIILASSTADEPITVCWPMCWPISWFAISEASSSQTAGPVNGV